MHPEKAFKLYINAMTGARSPATVKWYESKLTCLVEFLAEQPIENTTIHDLNAWRAELSKREEKYKDHPTKKPISGGIEQNTLRGYVRAARTWFKWLLKNDIISKDIYTNFELPVYVRHPRSGIEEDDRDRLIQAASGNQRDYAILCFLADTGCRLGGVATLTIDRLNLKSHRAEVSEKGRGGQNKYRTVYFSAETAYALATYLVSRPVCDHKEVFLGYVRGGKSRKKGWRPLGGPGIYLMIKRYAKPLGILDANPHNWRHGFARGATRRGMPLQTLAQLLGHSSEQVTADIYGTLDEDNLQQMHDAYTWLNKQIGRNNN